MAENALRGEVEKAAAILSRAAGEHSPGLVLREVGTVRSVARGTTRISGLPGLGTEEVVEFPGGVTGFAFNLDPDEAGIILLGDGETEPAQFERVLSPLGQHFYPKSQEDVPPDELFDLEARPRAELPQGRPALPDQDPLL